MNWEEYLLAVQLISDEGPGRDARRHESDLDRADAEARKALGVTDG